MPTTFCLSLCSLILPIFMRISDFLPVLEWADSFMFSDQRTFNNEKDIFISSNYGGCCLYVFTFVVRFVLAYDSWHDFSTRLEKQNFATDLWILKTHRILPSLKRSLKASTLKWKYREMNCKTNTSLSFYKSLFHSWSFCRWGWNILRFIQNLCCNIC